MANRFMSAVRKGVSGVQDVYARQQKMVEDRARSKLEKAKSNMERQRIKSGMELEKLKLQRELYQATIAVQKEKATVARLRKEAGVVTTRERFDEGARSLGRGAGVIADKLWGPPKRKTKKRKSK